MPLFIMNQPERMRISRRFDDLNVFGMHKAIGIQHARRYLRPIPDDVDRERTRITINRSVRAIRSDEIHTQLHQCPHRVSDIEEEANRRVMRARLVLPLRELRYIAQVR